MASQVYGITPIAYYDTSLYTGFNCKDISATVKVCLQGVANFFILICNGFIAVINFTTCRRAPPKVEVVPKVAPKLTITIDPPVSNAPPQNQPPSPPSPTPPPASSPQSAPPTASLPSEVISLLAVDTKHKEGSPVTPARTVPPTPPSPQPTPRSATPPAAPKKPPSPKASPKAGEEPIIVEPLPPSPPLEVRKVNDTPQSGGCVIA